MTMQQQPFQYKAVHMCHEQSWIVHRIVSESGGHHRRGKRRESDK